MEVTKPGNLVNHGTNTEIQVFSLLLQSPSNISHCLSRLRLTNILLHVNFLFLTTIIKTCISGLVPSWERSASRLTSLYRIISFIRYCINTFFLGYYSHCVWPSKTHKTGGSIIIFQLDNILEKFHFEIQNLSWV